jgi:hypothetical protein
LSKSYSPLKQFVNLKLEFEHDLIKAENLSTKCLALTAGSALSHIKLCRNVKQKISEEENPTISSIVSTVQEQ